MVNRCRTKKEAKSEKNRDQIAKGFEKSFEIFCFFAFHVEIATFGCTKKYCPTDEHNYGC